MMYGLVTSLTRAQKRVILLGIDVLVTVAALLIASFLGAGGLPIASGGLDTVLLIAVLVCTMLILTIAMGLHRIKVNSYELQGILESSAVAIALGLIGALTSKALNLSFPESTFVVLMMTYAILTIGIRLILRAYVIWLYSQHKPRKRVLIYGAGQTGQQLATALNTDDSFVAVGFVDDNVSLHGLTIGGLKVSSPTSIQSNVHESEVDRVVIAMPSASGATRAAISRRLRGIGCEVHSVPSFAEIVVEGVTSGQTHPVDLTSLLGRAAFEGALPGVNGAYSGRRVLVTGAGGSIGTELCRQLLNCAPECVVMLDHAEIALYSLHQELSQMDTGCDLIPVLGSVCEPAYMQRVMLEHRVDVVLHAAAYKHLPLVEGNIVSGLRNNVLGTRVVAQAAAQAGVERFILVSTDKAVRPTSVMGATKRVAELVIQDLARQGGKTRFSMVRFGNVLGSSGSVIPLFEQQIESGGPVTLTHRDVTRYFMTVSEAVSLVLLAGTFARGGEVFVLNMGKPVRIETLARQMILNAGYTVRDEANPNGDIEIAVTGLRHGEKLHEELLIGSDMLTTPHPKILRAQENQLGTDEMDMLMSRISHAVDTSDDDEALQILARWIQSSHHPRKHLDVVNG